MPTIGTGKITQLESFISTIQTCIESIVKHKFEEKKVYLNQDLYKIHGLQCAS
jgi:hypothetical protein